MQTLAWACALSGLLLGGIASFFPGFPGCAVALLGLVAFASLTDFQIVDAHALLLAALITMLGAFGQLLGPIASNRALRGSAASATGAAIGALLGAFIPVPGFFLASASIGALLGIPLSRREILASVRGSVGTMGGCLVSIASDGLAVLGVGAVLGLSDFWHQLPR